MSRFNALKAALGDTFAFAGADCEAMTMRVIQAWCQPSLPASG